MSDREFETARMGGMFGVLRDTAPDAWGRMILERQDRNRTWTELDYLLGASSMRVGALSYGPTAATAAAAWMPEIVFLIASVPALMTLAYYTFRPSASGPERPEDCESHESGG